MPEIRAHGLRARISALRWRSFVLGIDHALFKLRVAEALHGRIAQSDTDKLDVELPDAFCEPGIAGEVAL